MFGCGRCLIFSAVVYSGIVQNGYAEADESRGKVIQEMKIEAPVMTEEDQYGYNMPDRYKCDSCRAVAFHVNQALTASHPKSRRLKQWEYTDALDEVCSVAGGAYKGYGIKLIRGENALTGPGLPDNAEDISPGMGAIQMSSETWTKRLAEICRKVVYERVGEDEVYDKFYKLLRGEREGKLEEMCFELGDCSTAPKLPPTEPKEPKKSKKPVKKAAEPAPKKPAVPPAPKATKAKQAPVAATPGVDASRVDAQAFLRNLAVRHGFTSDEYVSSRSQADWERLFLRIGSRLFADSADTAGK